MLFIPKKTKYKKEQRGEVLNRIKANVGFMRLNFGNIGLKAVSSGQVSSKQLIALIKTIKKTIKKRGKLKINIFPSTPITKKATGIRMGKGKGSIDSWVFKVRAGVIICEIATKFTYLAKRAFNLSKIRVPISTKIIFF